MTEADLGGQWGFSFHAGTSADPHHFHLTITETDNSYADFLLLDEVLDRRQFVVAFCDVFEQFLAKDYNVYDSSEGKHFDLRTLR